MSSKDGTAVVTMMSSSSSSSSFLSSDSVSVRVFFTFFLGVEGGNAEAARDRLFFLGFGVRGGRTFQMKMPSRLREKLRRES